MPECPEYESTAALRRRNAVLFLPLGVFRALPAAIDDGRLPIGRPAGELRPGVRFIGQIFSSKRRGASQFTTIAAVRMLAAAVPDSTRNSLADKRRGPNGLSSELPEN